MASNMRHSMPWVLTLYSLLLINSVLGNFDNPFLEELDVPIDGVTVNPQDGEVRAEENLGDNFPFRVAKIKVIGTGDVVIQQPVPEISVHSDDGIEWFLVLNDQLDRERISRYAFSISHGSDTRLLVVTVIDVNDNPPRIINNPQEELDLEVWFELAPIKPNRITFIVGEDPDEIDIGQLRYSFEHLIGRPLDGDPIFRMDPISGELFQLKEFDYNIAIMHRLRLIVEDSGTYPDNHNDSVIVTINVEDIPNMPPEFIRLPAGLNVNEGTGIGTVIETVVARDGDLALNWEIEYTLEETHENPLTSDLFDINSRTGQILVKSEIDAEELFFYENTVFFDITIKAQEIAPPGQEDYANFTTGVISVTIRDINNKHPEICVGPNAPVFTDVCETARSYTIEIPETLEGSLPLDDELSFFVRDLDLTYSYSRYRVDIVGDGIINRAFKMQPAETSSGITQYSIVVSDTSALDFDDGSFWWENSSGNIVPKPQTFDIVFTELDVGATATITITLTVTDENDNPPKFDVNEIEINVCENTPDGVQLMERPLPQPSICRNSGESSTLVKIIANDADITPIHRDITYGWSESSRKPPVRLDPKEGTMTMDISEDAINFDYERFPTEYFILEASDGLTTTQISIRFNILDQNDVSVRINLGPSSQVEVREDDSVGKVILKDIIFEDVDVDPDVQIGFNVLWDSAYTLENGVYKQIDFAQEDNKQIITSWFSLVRDELNGNANRVLADFILNPQPIKPIDRELDYLTTGGVDRVDLQITAFDAKSETPDDILQYQVLTIRIVDANDNPPVFEDIDQVVDPSPHIFETRDPDNESPIQKDIYTFRARDDDLLTDFDFDIEVEGHCINECEAYRGLVELRKADNPRLGRATLYRVEKIDREAKIYFGPDIETDFLNYTIVVTDGIHESRVEISIVVDDINDNAPIWDDDYSVKPYQVMELVPEFQVETFLATDLDHPAKYGDVSYSFVDTGVVLDMFSIGEKSGVLTFNGPVEWSTDPSFTIQVQAVDNNGALFDSLRTTATITIKVIDENNHSPRFITDNSNPLGEIFETVPEVDVPLEGVSINVVDDDDPSQDGNGQFDVSITKVWKEEEELEGPLPFRTLERSSPSDNIIRVVPTVNLTNKWGDYSLEFTAQDRGSIRPQPPSTEIYRIIIVNENLNTPVLTYPNPDNETIVVIPLTSVVGEPLRDWNNVQLQKIDAIDDDDDKLPNGQFWFEIIQNEDDEHDGFDFFEIREGSNLLYLKNPFVDINVQYYNVYIKVEDLGTPPRASVGRIQFYMLPESNRPPIFNDTTPLNISIIENVIGIETKIRAGHDPDFQFPELPDIPLIGLTDIYYHIVGGTEGSKEYFRIDNCSNTTPDPDDPDGVVAPCIITKQELDREFIKEHQLIVFLSNYKDAPEMDYIPVDRFPEGDISYLLINIEVENEFDTSPEFPQVEDGGIVSGGFSRENNQGDVIMTIQVIDRDDFDYVTFKLSETFISSDSTLTSTTPFTITQVPESNTTASLGITFAPQPNMKGFYSFNITATDLGQLSTTVQCKMYMIKDSNVVEFRFFDLLAVVDGKKEQLAIALTTAFEYRCNIDRLSTAAENANITVVKTHFIDLSTNTPVEEAIIKQRGFIPDVRRRLSDEMAKLSLVLEQIGNETSPETDNNFTIYLLIGGLGFLGVVLIVLSSTCYFNNRSLSRKVRALTATTFGSQMSGLNRTGAALQLPNTNEFAIEGANPMWTSMGDPNEKRRPAFDAESVGSGGSVLIGVEDDDDFRNYKNNGDASAPFDASDEDDLYDHSPNPSQSHQGQNSRNAMYEESDDNSPPNNNNNYNHSENGDDNISNDQDQLDYGDPPTYQSDGNNGDNNELDFDMPPPGFGNTSMRRNPLVNMSFDDDA